MDENFRALCAALRNGVRHDDIPLKTLESLKEKRLVEDRGSLGRVWFLTERGAKKLNGVATR
jgi:hypothetical protein